MSDPDKTPNDDDLSRRLDSLKDRLTETKGYKEPEVAEEEHAGSKANVGQALRLGSEFIAGIVVGAALGYGFDYLFGTSPWGFIILFLLGFLAAILNVMRAAGLVAESGMRLKNAQELAEQREKETVRTKPRPKPGNSSEKE